MEKTKKFSMLAAAVAVLVVGASSLAMAATKVNLGSADNFAVLAGTAITNVPTSAITGDVGLSPAGGSSYTGLTAAQVTGTIYAVDGAGPAGSVNNPALLTTAKADLTAAYLDAAGQTTTGVISADLGGQTLTPGVYEDNDAPDSLSLTGTLTLDAQGDPNAVFIFKSGSTLTTAASSNIVLANGAQACNVFWQVTSSATLGANSTFRGNILALTSITLTTGATVDGRILARNGAVTLDSNTVSRAACAAATTTTTTTTTTPVPSFPDTGLAPDGTNNNVWYVMIPAWVVAALFSFWLVRRKQRGNVAGR